MQNNKNMKQFSCCTCCKNDKIRNWELVQNFSPRLGYMQLQNRSSLIKYCVGRPNSYDSFNFSAKSYVFLVHKLMYITPFQYTICLKARYNFFYVNYLLHSHHITTLQSFTSLFVRHDQTLKSRIFQMMRQKIKVGIFKVALDDIRYLQGQ